MTRTPPRAATKPGPQPQGEHAHRSRRGWVNTRPPTPGRNGDAERIVEGRQSTPDGGGPRRAVLTRRVMGSQAELAHLFRALKAPAAARSLPKLADRARAEEWSYERFVQMLLETEVSARDSHGGEARIRQARFSARKTLEEFDFTFQRSVKKTVIEHLGQLDFLHAKDCIVALGPPGTGKTHCETPFSVSSWAAARLTPTWRS